MVATGWDSLRPVLALFFVLLAIVGGFGVAANVVDLSNPSYDVLVTSLMATTVLVHWARDRVDLRAWTQSRTGPSALAAWTMLAGALLAAWMTSYFWLLSSLFFDTEGYLAPFRTHGWPLWSAFVLTSVAPGVFEELAFRGVIQRRLGGVMSSTEAVVVQAAMFSVLHLLPTIFVSHFVFGLILGFLRERVGRLWPGMVVHGAWNSWVLWLEV